MRRSVGSDTPAWGLEFVRFRRNRSWDVLGVLLGRSWSLLASLGRLLASLCVPVAFRERFWNDFGAIFGAKIDDFGSIFPHVAEPVS